MEPEIIDFIVEAKRKTYATQGEGGEEKLKDGAKRLSYKKGELSYQDTYYGSSDFAGQEVVFRGGKGIWSMNYRGVTLTESDRKTLYAFLKESLQQVDCDAPYRGPRSFTRGAYRYENEFEGDCDNFSGKEQIKRNGAVVFELTYCGGWID